MPRTPVHLPLTPTMSTLPDPASLSTQRMDRDRARHFFRDLAPRQRCSIWGFFLRQKLAEPPQPAARHPAGPPAEEAWFVGEISAGLWLVATEDAQRTVRLCYCLSDFPPPSRPGIPIFVAPGGPDVLVRATRPSRGQPRGIWYLLSRLLSETCWGGEQHRGRRQWRLVEVRTLMEVVGTSGLEFRIQGFDIGHDEVCPRLVACCIAEDHQLFEKMLAGAARYGADSVVHEYSDGGYDSTLIKNMRGTWSGWWRRESNRPNVLERLALFDAGLWWTLPRGWGVLRHLARHPAERVRHWAFAEFCKICSSGGVEEAASLDQPTDQQLADCFSLPGAATIAVKTGKRAQGIRPESVKALFKDLRGISAIANETGLHTEHAGHHVFDQYQDRLRHRLRELSFLYRRGVSWPMSLTNLAASWTAAGLRPDLPAASSAAWKQASTTALSLWRRPADALHTSAAPLVPVAAYALGRMAPCAGEPQSRAWELVFRSNPRKLPLGYPRQRRLIAQYLAGATRSIVEGRHVEVDHDWWFSYFEGARRPQIRRWDPYGRLLSPVMRMAAGHSASGCQVCRHWILERLSLELASASRARTPPQRVFLRDLALCATGFPEALQDVAQLLEIDGAVNPWQVFKSWRDSPGRQPDQGQGFDGHRPADLLDVLCAEGKAFQQHSTPRLSGQALRSAWRERRTEDALVSLLRDPDAPGRERDAAWRALQAKWPERLDHEALAWDRFPSEIRVLLILRSTADEPAPNLALLERWASHIAHGTSPQEIEHSVKALAGHWLALPYDAGSRQKLVPLLTVTQKLLKVGAQQVVLYGMGRGLQVVQRGAAALLHLSRAVGFTVLEIGGMATLSSWRDKLLEPLGEIWRTFPELAAERQPVGFPGPERWEEGVAPWLPHAGFDATGDDPWLTYLARVASLRRSNPIERLRGTAKALRELTTDSQVSDVAELSAPARKLLTDLMNDHEFTDRVAGPHGATVLACIQSLDHLLEESKWGEEEVGEFREVLRRVSTSLEDIAYLLAFQRTDAAYSISVAAAKVPAPPNRPVELRLPPVVEASVVRHPVVQLHPLIFVLAELTHNAARYARGEAPLVLELGVLRNRFGEVWALTVDEPDVDPQRFARIEESLTGRLTGGVGGRGLGLVRDVLRASGCPDATGGYDIVVSPQPKCVRWRIPLRAPLDKKDSST